MAKGLTPRQSAGIVGNLIAFEVRFEGCGQCDQSKRIAYAKQVFDAFAP